MFEFPVADQAQATLLMNPEQTVVTLFGECEAKTMQELVQLIHELNALPVEEQPTEFKIVLNSVGGDLYAALPLYEAIKGSLIPVWVQRKSCIQVSTNTI
jgi:ATP-dependent protease ClpP protease subunit